MNKEMKKRDDFTDMEWEELASLLSDETSANPGTHSKFRELADSDEWREWKNLGNIKSDMKPDVDKAWNLLNTRIKGEEKPSFSYSGLFLRSSLIRVAASVLILLSLGITAVMLTKSGTFDKKIIMATGENQKNLLVELPDGSKIYLNRNTELTYNSKFGEKRRDVKLTGEAFFEIAPDITKPFIIDAGNAKVRVVGTSFNVITSNESSSVEVFVRTGKVQLSDNSGEQSIMLDPGFIGTIDSKQAARRENSNPNYLSWNTGLLVYKGEKLEIVFRDLKRVYNMDIIADDQEILENQWSAPIDNLASETIISLICTSFNLSYTLDGAVYHLSKK